MAKLKRGLGRGVDALLGPAPVQSEESAAEEKPVVERPARTIRKPSAGTNVNVPEGVTVDEQGTMWVDPRLLKANPHQPRTSFDEAELNDLAASIREHGIIQPITIEPAEEGNFYIIAGERRTRASIIAGLEKVPVQIKHYNEEKKLEIALIENIQRADLNPVEEAQAYYNLMQLAGLNQDEVAKKVGKNRTTVANALRLLKLPQDMQDSLTNGQITAGHARALLAVVNPADQRVLFGKVVANSMSVREAENQAKNLNEGGRAAKKDKKEDTEKRDPDIMALEQKFINALGTKVSLKGSLSRGSLVVDFFSRADLDRLYSILIKEE